MTLQELADTLPNGLHDAEITMVRADYIARIVVFDCSIWVGDMVDEGRREAYRDAELVVEGLQFLCMEAPDPRYPFKESGSLRIDLAIDTGKSSLPAVKSVDRDCFVSCLFVGEWNSFIHLAARSASLSWRGETYVRDGHLAKPSP